MKAAIDLREFPAVALIGRLRANGLSWQQQADLLGLRKPTPYSWLRRGRRFTAYEADMYSRRAGFCHPIEIWPEWASVGVPRWCDCDLDRWGSCDCDPAAYGPRERTNT